jgi:hypothetical protein
MSDTPFAASGVKVWRVRRSLARGAARAALGFCLGPVAFAVAASVLERATVIGHELTDASLYVWLFAWLAGMPLASLVSLFASRRSRQPFTAIEVSEGDLRMSAPAREQLVPRSRIQGALVKPEERGEAEVELTLGSGDSLCVHARGREEELARALGFGAPLRRTVVPLGEARTPVTAVWLAAIGGLFSTCGVGTVGVVALPVSGAGWDYAWYALGAWFIVSTALFDRLLSPGRLVVGADGVVLEGPFRKRFFRRDSIEDAIFVGRHLALIVREGDRLRQVNLTSEGYTRKDALFYRIREALALPAEGGARPGSAVLLRGNESIAEWRERLRKLAVSGHGYRTGGLPMDVLVRTAADATAPAAARLGAAAAIAFGDDGEAKKELRIATEGIANDKMRIAMVSAADGMAEEEAIAAALQQEEKSQRA